MKTVNIPDGYQQVMPYLIVKGAAQFFEFMQTVFNAEQRFKTMRDEHTVMHAELTIGTSVIMYADSTETYEPQTAGLFVYIDDCDAVYQKALDAGATSVMPPVNQNYGRSAGVADPFGNTWWITNV